MCSLIRNVNKDIEFGSHFVVSGYDRSVFLRFVDTFFGLQAEGEDNLKLEYVCSARHPGEQMRTSSTADICYTYWTTAVGDHELWMFGTLARLDWSKLGFEFPSLKADRALNCLQFKEYGEDEFRGVYDDVDERDTIFRCEEKVGGSDHEDQDDEYEEDDHGGAIFVAGDEATLPDTTDEEALLDSEDESRSIDSEYETGLLDDGDESWSDTNY